MVAICLTPAGHPIYQVVPWKLFVFEYLQYVKAAHTIPLKCPPTPSTVVGGSNPHMRISAYQALDKVDGGSNPRMRIAADQVHLTLSETPTNIHTISMVIQGTHVLLTAPLMLTT